MAQKLSHGYSTPWGTEVVKVPSGMQADPDVVMEYARGVEAVQDGWFVVEIGILGIERYDEHFLRKFLRDPAP